MSGEHDAIVDRVVARARSYPVEVGDVVGCDDEPEQPGEVLVVRDDGRLVVDFGPDAGVRAVPAAICFDLYLAQHFAAAEVEGRDVGDVAALRRQIRALHSEDRAREERPVRHGRYVN